MPKMATKAADNVFYKARIAAASWNDRLGSREGAAEVTGIDRTRLANIELGTINPHPEEVLMLADTYNAPELQNHFCSHLCPLGIGTISPIELEELERVTLQLISAMKSLPEVKDGIIDIAADGVIDAEEKPRINGGNVVFRDERDNAKATRHILVEALQYPKLDDPELMKYYNCVDITQMPEKVFSRADEFAHVTRVVMALLGIGGQLSEEEQKQADEKEIDDAKN